MWFKHRWLASEHKTAARSGKLLRGAITFKGLCEGGDVSIA
jgi:hypothetical protein